MFTSNNLLLETVRVAMHDNVGKARLVDSSWI
jgi:hypothetical protein